MPDTHAAWAAGAAGQHDDATGFVVTVTNRTAVVIPKLASEPGWTLSSDPGVPASMARARAAALPLFPELRSMGGTPVTTQPGDQAAGAGDRGHLRASHADREQVIGTLKAAFVAGMLAKDEFDLRVGQAFASRTYADLAALTPDLPAGLAVTEPRKAARTPDQIMQRPGRMMAAATVLYAGVWAFTFLPPWPTNSEGEPPGAVVALFLLSTLAYLSALLFGVVNVVVLCAYGPSTLPCDHARYRGRRLACPRRPGPGPQCAPAGLPGYVQVPARLRVTALAAPCPAGGGWYPGGAQAIAEFGDRIGDRADERAEYGYLRLELVALIDDGVEDVRVNVHVAFCPSAQVNIGRLPVRKGLRE